MRDPLAGFLLLVACQHAPPAPGVPAAVAGGGEAPMSAVRSWSIYDGDQLVLTVRGEPGAITSTAAPSPSMRPVQHPFLSAAAREAGHESQLKDLLDQSTSVDDFLARLGAAGFRIDETTTP